MSSKEFVNLSGPWSGFSIQEGFRITERMSLTISKKDSGASRFREITAEFNEELFEEYAQIEQKPLVSIRGWGTDSDGDFVMDGFYDPATEAVRIIRRYIRVSRMGGSVGYPFLFAGKWDGMMVYGQWSGLPDPEMNGPFEMWPEREEDIEEREIVFEEVERLLPNPLVGV